MPVQKAIMFWGLVLSSRPSLFPFATLVASYCPCLSFACKKRHHMFWWWSLRVPLAKQPVRVPTKQANSLHPPRTEEQLQACSIGRKSLTAPVQSKEEGGGSVCGHAARASADRPNRQTVCTTQNTSKARLTANLRFGCESYIGRAL